MNYLHIYLIISLITFTYIYFENKRMVGCYQDICTLIGLSLLWPITFIIELIVLWKHHRYINAKKNYYRDLDPPEYGDELIK